MARYCSIEEQKDAGFFLSNEKKTKWVALITLVTMFVEVSVGYWSGSMALLADGWHMASHALALFLSVFVYYLYRHPKFRSRFTFGGGKILSLGGYTSALFLILIAVSMIWESFLHFYQNEVIHYNEAILVASIGLLVNVVCAFILYQGGELEDIELHHEDHHDHKHDGKCTHGKKLAPLTKQVRHHGHSHSHEHAHSHSHTHDHNHESAYVHILTDALTSLLAIVALLLAKWQGLTWPDPLVGIIGGVVVLKWSVGLIRQSGMDLLDAHEVTISQENLVKKLEEDGSKVLDMHLWRLAPGQVGCEIVIRRNREQMSSDYRDMIRESFNIHHLIIEVV